MYYRDRLCTTYENDCGRHQIHIDLNRCKLVYNKLMYTGDSPALPLCILATTTYPDGVSIYLTGRVHCKSMSQSCGCSVGRSDGQSYDWSLRESVSPLDGMSFGGLDLPSHPPYFRFLTLLAIYIFKNHNFAENTQDDISGSGVTDTMLLEVGIGGRYDATNLFTSAKATCVTTLDYDHCRTLGYKLSEIAFEKGYISKDNLVSLAKSLAQNQYGQYLLRCTEREF